MSDYLKSKIDAAILAFAFASGAMGGRLTVEAPQPQPIKCECQCRCNHATPSAKPEKGETSIGDGTTGSPIGAEPQ